MTVERRLDTRPSAWQVSCVILIQDGKKYEEKSWALESDFETEVLSCKGTIFGKKSVYIDAKKKIGTLALGNTIPDGFLFDFSDPDNPEFYIVEVELKKHDFYSHIFPQITKFFAFFRSSKRQKELVGKLFTTISGDSSLKKEFKVFLGEKEIFKALTDLIESSQNILLVIDGSKPELPEITDTYSDTWGKMVRVLEIRKFESKDSSVLTCDPSFENIELAFDETIQEAESKTGPWSEEHHLEGVTDTVKEIYRHLRSIFETSDGQCRFNPQKYYVSIKTSRNVVFLKVRKKKLRMVVMLPEHEIKQLVKDHPVKSISQPQQDFYNGPCAEVDVDSMFNIGEIETLIRTAIQSAEKASV